MECCTTYTIHIQFCTLHYILVYMCKKGWEAIFEVNRKKGKNNDILATGLVTWMPFLLGTPLPTVDCEKLEPLFFPRLFCKYVS